MLRKIIQIDADRCDGCGICVNACHEGAIHLVRGKAELAREDYCDGLGDCLPVCPRNAISIEEREAPAYDEAAVKAEMRKRKQADNLPRVDFANAKWPLQLRLVSENASFLASADLLIAADCTAIACSRFHAEIAGDQAVLIGCPKLDDADYGAKIAAIIRGSNIRAITVARMSVPCCKGLEFAVKQAIADNGKSVDCKIVEIDLEGNIALLN